MNHLLVTVSSDRSHALPRPQIFKHNQCDLGLFPTLWDCKSQIWKSHMFRNNVLKITYISARVQLMIVWSRKLLLWTLRSTTSPRIRGKYIFLLTPQIHKMYRNIFFWRAHISLYMVVVVWKHRQQRHKIDINSTNHIIKTVSKVLFTFRKSMVH